MDRRSAKRLLGFGTAVSLAAVAALGMAAASASATPSPTDNTGQVDICHATSSGTNPYVFEHPSKDSIIKDSGHDSHPNDVIPPFDYTVDDTLDGTTAHYPGKNWANGGQALIDAQCFPLGIKKTAPASVLGGSTINYTITVTNLGFLPIKVSDISVLDPTVTDLSFVSSSHDPLGHGDTATWSGTKATTVVGCGEPVDNTAIVSFAKQGVGDDDLALADQIEAVTPAKRSASDTVTTDVVCPTVSIKKTATNGPVAPGGTATYDIVVGNEASLPLPLNWITVHDPAPAVLTAPTVPDPLQPKGEANSSAAWTATVPVPADQACGSMIENTAWVSVFPPDAVPVVLDLARGVADGPDVQLPPSSTATTDVVCPVQVSLAKSTGQATVEPGGNVNYTVGVTNTGSFTIPDGAITVKDPTATLGAPDSTGPLAPGATRTWTATRAAGADATACGTSVNNNATVSLDLPAGYSDTGSGARSADATAVLVSGGICTPPPPPETPLAPQDTSNPVVFRPASGVLELTKTGPKSSLAGGKVTFTLKVTNTGSSDLTGVVIRDKPPATMLLGGAPVNATVSNGRVLWNVGTLAAGASATRELPVTLLRSVRGKTCNTATAVADGTDQVRSKACTTVIVGRRPATPVTG